MDSLIDKMIFSIGSLKYLESFENLMRMSCNDKIPDICEIPIPLIKKDKKWYTKFKNNNKLDTKIINSLIIEDLYASFDEHGNIGLPVLENIELMPVDIGKMFIRSCLISKNNKNILDFFRVISVCSKAKKTSIIALKIEHERLDDRFISQVESYFANRHNKY